MNILSKRLYTAISNPNIKSIRKTSGFHPSAASIKLPSGEVLGACMRDSYYRMTEVGGTNQGPPDYTISANLGDKMHQYIDEILDKFGYSMGIQKIESEHSFFDEDLNLSGRSDIIAWDHINQEIIGIEVKSVGEYKASKVLEVPDHTHIMQSMLYLDFYSKKIPDGMHRPNKWYIWYISRTEGYAIKSRKHGSPFQMLWDYYITLHNDHVVVHTSAGSYSYPELTVSGIKDRYNQLKLHLENNIAPPRDYQIQYSEEKIADLYKRDKLTRKADKEKVEKWLAKGAKEGKLKIELGDIECSFCSFKDHCWDQKAIEQPTYFSFPKEQEKVDESYKKDIL